jgi:hypothetical protein
MIPRFSPVALPKPGRRRAYHGTDDGAELLLGQQVDTVYSGNPTSAAQGAFGEVARGHRPIDGRGGSAFPIT